MRVAVLLLKAVELFHALGGLPEAQAHGTSCPSASSQSCTKPLIVTALKHKTSDTLLMCSLSRVMSTGESTPFPAERSVPVDSVEHPWAQAPDLSRSVLHLWDMSMNLSRTMGSSWTLRRFAVLLLGSSSTSAAAVVAGAAQRVYGRSPLV